MPLEQMNGKLDGRKEEEWRRRMTTIAKEKVEWSCWKTNNEKSKLVVGLWKTS